MHGLWGTDVCWWSMSMVHVHKWLADSQLHLDIKKTVCMFLSKSNTASGCDPKVQISGEVIQTVSQYLGVILDCILSLKQVQKVMHVTKYNLSNLEYKKLPDSICSKTLYDCHDHASPILLHDLDPGNHHNTETCPFTVQASSRSWVENLSCIITATYLINTKCSAGKT